MRKSGRHPAFLPVATRCLTSARQARGRINHDAHLGGALTGLAFVLFTDPGAYAGLMRVVLG